MRRNGAYRGKNYKTKVYESYKLRKCKYIFTITFIIFLHNKFQKFFNQGSNTFDK